MKAKLLLRIAAILILVHLLGHSVGHFTWDKAEDPKMQEVITAMKSHKAEFMGAEKSMADYYNGYSLMTFGLFAMTICILWFASGYINTNRPIARQILLPVGIVYLFFGIVEFMAFFPFAASMSFLAGALTLITVTLKK